MTNEEAREQIENLRAHCSDMARSTFTGGEVLWAKDVEALGQAIKALKQEPCEDAISRQSVLEIIEREQFKGDAISEIEKLSSVIPQHTEAEIQKMQELEQAEIQKAYELGKAKQPKTGHWIKEWNIDHFEQVCSECGCGEHFKSNYCPNCGCRMESEVEE